MRQKQHVKLLHVEHTDDCDINFNIHFSRYSYIVNVINIITTLKSMS